MFPVDLCWSTGRHGLVARQVSLVSIICSTLVLQDMFLFLSPSDSTLDCCATQLITAILAFTTTLRFLWATNLFLLIDIGELNNELHQDTLKAFKELEQPTSDHDDWRAFTNTLASYLDPLVNKCPCTQNALHESSDVWKQIDIHSEEGHAGSHKGLNIWLCLTFTAILLGMLLNNLVLQQTTPACSEPLVLFDQPSWQACCLFKHHQVKYKQHLMTQLESGALSFGSLTVTTETFKQCSLTAYWDLADEFLSKFDCAFAGRNLDFCQCLDSIILTHLNHNPTKTLSINLHALPLELL